jgi:hypothetical protein
MALLHNKYGFLALCFAVTLLFPCVGKAQDDYGREGRRSSTRLSERDQRSFETFLDSHDETAQELYRNPELVKNERFLKGHSALSDWLDDHRDAAAIIEANPRAVIWREPSTKEREPSTGEERERSSGEREREERQPTTGETLRDLLTPR